MTAPPTDVPVDDADLYSDDFIRDPWPGYARLRDKGSVVWLSRLGAYAVTRHAEARTALSDHETFVSSQGVAGDDYGCQFLRGNTVASDPPRHTALRQAIEPPLRKRAIEELRPRIEAQANALIDDLVGRDGFDGVKDLAQALPLAIVRDLVGLPEFERDAMLRWAAAAFDMLGVQNARGVSAHAAIGDMRAFIGERANLETLTPGGWTHRVLSLAEKGEVDPELAPFAVRDLINPSLDTTIAAIAHLAFNLARTPEALRLLRVSPQLVSNAVQEAVRIGTPIRSFSRRTVRPTTLGEATLAADARVLILFASANRDERVFEHPDRFDVTRPARRHLGFGAGIHMCVGMHLALLEMEALLGAIVARVDRIEAGVPEPLMNNTICSFAAMPMRFVALH